MEELLASFQNDPWADGSVAFSGKTRNWGTAKDLQDWKQAGELHSGLYLLLGWPVSIMILQREKNWLKATWPIPCCISYENLQLLGAWIVRFDFNFHNTIYNS